jgi:hypothetical protein
MPILPLLGAGLSVGTGLITRQWRRKEEKGRRAYEKIQELDRRKYDQAMWEKVNKYNNPIEQMARLQAAGLNPNLIYGSSPGSAVGNAQSIATGKQLQGQAPQYQLDNPITPFMDTKVKQAQTNNLNTSAMKNIAASNLSDSQTNKLNSLLSSEITMAEEGAKQSALKTNMDRLRNKAMSNKETGIAVKYATETSNLLLDNQIKEAQTEVQNLNKFLASNGIRPGDPLWFRFFGVAFNKGVEITDKIKQEIQELFKQLKR